MDDFRAGASCHLFPGQWIRGRILKAREHVLRLDTHRFGNPLAIGDKAGNHRHGVTVRMRKQRCLLAVETLGNGGKLEFQRDAGLNNREAVACRKMIEPAAQRRDRLRTIGPHAGRRSGSARSRVRHADPLHSDSLNAMPRDAYFVASALMHR